MTRVPDKVGDTFADVLHWTWDRAAMRHVAEHKGARLCVDFHKIGGRYSKQTGRSKLCYWTISLTPADTYGTRSLTHFLTADAAKAAVVEMYVRHLRGKAALQQGRAP